MSKPSDYNAEKGRVNWDALRAQTQEEIDRIAEAEQRELGLDKRTYRTRIVINVPVPDVKKIREKLHLSQAAFAERFHLRERTVQQWEQRRTLPDLPARILLRAIESFPDAIAEAAAAVAHEEEEFASMEHHAVAS